MAALIFGPVRRRLADIERTAEAIGQGRLDARAREDGGDEVADLARSFNLMASDLAARAREVEGADRARRLLLADVSHELMTPLTSMRGYLETLAMPRWRPTRKRGNGICGSSATRRGGSSTSSATCWIWRGSRPAARRSTSRTSRWKGLIGAVTARHELDAGARGVTLRTSIEPGAEIVRGDARRLEQALQNLVANALRHTPHWRRGQHRLPPGGIDRGDRGPRYGRRHRPGAPAPPVRPVLQGRSVAGRGRNRQRAGIVDREGGDGPPPGSCGGRQFPRRQHVRVAAAGRGSVRRRQTALSATPRPGSGSARRPTAPHQAPRPSRRWRAR